MTQKRESIVQSPIFGGLNSEQIDQIAVIGRDVHFTRGASIFIEGDPGDGFYVVAAGKVKVFKVSAEGKEQILHIYGPGQPFGEVPVFAGQNFPANALAVENSHLIFFPRQSFIDLISANPSLALNMLAMLSKRLRQFTVQVENLSLKEVPGRLASYLIYLAQEQGDSRNLQLPMSKGQLASLLGTIPETLSRIFNKMSAQGYIDVQGSQIVIENSQALQDLAHSGRLSE